MILLFLGMTIFSCQDEITEFASYENLDNIVTRNIMSRSVIPEQFDWENSDWMPTPPEQSPIPTPWIGQGSIASTYGLDIVNDRKKSEGWELMYSTFRHEGGPLVNPYFILYNKYRGDYAYILLFNHLFCCPFKLCNKQFIYYIQSFHFFIKFYGNRDY